MHAAKTACRRVFHDTNKNTQAPCNVGKTVVRLLEIDRTADKRLEQLTASFMEAENVNEALKAKDQMTSTEKAVQDKLYPVQLLRF